MTVSYDYPDAGVFYCEGHGHPEDQQEYKPSPDADMEEITKVFSFLISKPEKLTGKVIALDPKKGAFEVLHEAMMNEAEKAGYSFLREETVNPADNIAYPMAVEAGQILYYFQNT